MPRQDQGPIQIPLTVNLEARVDPSSTNLSTSSQITSYIRNGFVELDNINNTKYVRRRGGYEAFSKDITSYSTLLGYIYDDYSKYHLSIITDGTDKVFEIRQSAEGKVEHTLVSNNSTFFDFTIFGLGSGTRRIFFNGSIDGNITSDEGNAWYWDTDVASAPIKLINAVHGFPENETLTRGIVELDNYIFVMTVYGDLYNSNVGDPLVWTSTDFLNVNTSQDKKVFLARHQDHIVALGTSFITFYYDAGNPSGSPLALRKDLTIPIGVLNHKTSGTLKHNIADQDISPSGLEISSDGTKVYMAGISSNTIYQYDLDEAYDISTANYSNKLLSVAAQTSVVGGVSLSSDGTKAYIVGNDATDFVYQYTLSTAWDISTGTYASKSLNLGAVTSVDLEFKPDGTEVYIIETGLDVVNQYTLSTAWDISTGTFTGASPSVATEDGNARSLSLSSDGTKAYIGGANTRTIYQYTLSTAWDITTLSYASKFFTQSAPWSPAATRFNTDGTTIYVLDNSSNRSIYQYTLTTAYDISTAEVPLYYHYTYSVGEDNQYIAFIGVSPTSTGADDKERTHNGVYLLDNFRLKKISTDAVDTLISIELQDTTNNKLKVGIHTIEGRKVILVGNTSLVYDIEKDIWYWWTWGTDTTFTWEEVSGEFIAKAGANILKYSAKHTQDQDAVTTPTYLKFSYTIQTPQTTLGISNNKFCRDTTLIGDYTPGQEDLEISWTDDNYQTFSTARGFDLQHYRKLTRCGIFRKRAWKIHQDSTTIGSRYPVRLSHIEINVDGSNVNTAD